MTLLRSSIAWGVAVWLLSAATSRAADSPLADAAERRDWKAVRSLIDQRIEVNASQADGMTALHWAVLHDDASIVAQLIEEGAEVNAKNRYSVTPLALACVNGNGDIVNRLTASGADVHEELPGGETVLMTAARTGRIGPVNALLTAGVNVNARERNGQTALMWAAAEGHLEVADALLKAGAELKTRLPSGFTALFFAVREGRTAVALRLINAGEAVNQIMRPDGKKAAAKLTTPLLLAIENGHFQLGEALLHAGADANAKPAGYSALHALTWVRKPTRGDGDPPPRGSGNLSSLDIARKLIEHGANVNARFESDVSEPGRFSTAGSTPFLLAARASDVPYMRLLLDVGADPTLANAVNCTPLLAAAGVGALENGDEPAGMEVEAVETVRLLLDLGANVNAVDDTGESAMHGAAYQSWPRVAGLLARRGADAKVWNRKNQLGWTPLMIAQGHRPGNFRPAPETVAAIAAAMSASEGDGNP
ncbi:MAG TPA: ankyrin repeat domain-containing protein [Lacipirellula sp.]